MDQVVAHGLAGGVVFSFTDDWFTGGHQIEDWAVCTYNGAATLRECLASLVRLNYPDCEVIVVDDGSTDGTAEIVREFAQVRYIHQESRGLSVARNVGAQAACGDIIAYTDDDCVADEDWLGVFRTCPARPGGGGDWRSEHLSAVR